MIAIAYLAGTVAICAVVYLILMGCRSIITLADELNSDQRNGYKLPAAIPPEALPKSRPCPTWMRRANWRAAR